MPMNRKNKVESILVPDGNEARLRRSLDILVPVTIDNDIKLIKSDMQLPQLAGLWPGTSPAVTWHAFGTPS